MGWLECEPEPLFKKDRFSVGDVQWVVPHQVQYVVRRAALMLPSGLVTLPLQPILDFEFVARPMQVGGLLSTLNKLGRKSTVVARAASCIDVLCQRMDCVL